MVAGGGGGDGIGEHACADDGERGGEAPGDGHETPRIVPGSSDGCGAVVSCRPDVTGAARHPGRHPPGTPVNPYRPSGGAARRCRGRADSRASTSPDLCIDRVNHLSYIDLVSVFITAGHPVRPSKDRLATDPYRRVLSAPAAAVTSGANRGPGRRPSRSTGPDTEMAATTCPDRSRTGADTDATPASRWATLYAQPRRRTSASARGPKRAAGRLLVLARPRREHLRPRARRHRQPGAERDRGAQPGGPLRGRHADPLVAVAPVELGALAAAVAQPGQHRPRGGQQRVGRAAAPARRAADRAPTGRPASRTSSRCVSSATASRCAVARGSPVASHQLAEPDRRDRAAASSTATDLSSTPTPLGCPMAQDR